MVEKKLHTEDRRSIGRGVCWAVLYNLQFQLSDSIWFRRLFSLPILLSPFIYYWAIWFWTKTYSLFTFNHYNLLNVHPNYNMINLWCKSCRRFFFNNAKTYLTVNHNKFFKVNNVKFLFYGEILMFPTQDFDDTCSNATWALYVEIKSDVIFASMFITRI